MNSSSTSRSEVRRLDLAVWTHFSRQRRLTCHGWRTNVGTSGAWQAKFFKSSLSPPIRVGFEMAAEAVNNLGSDTCFREALGGSDDRPQRSEAYLAEAQKLSHTGSFGWHATRAEIYWPRETFRISEYETNNQGHGSPDTRTNSPRRQIGCRATDRTHFAGKNRV